LKVNKLVLKNALKMATREILDDIKNRLVKAYDPVAIYLFCSYVWGTPNEESDVDY
jgi:predicted nucleotidyltransferase